MSRPHDGHRASFPFGNPFRLIFPKGSYLSPWLVALLNSFEETLAGRLMKLKPKDKSDVLSLSWLRLAMESLCETHTDIKTLINEIQLPVSEWDKKWMDVYLDNSVRLLDLCIAFSSELSLISQGQLFLQCARHSLDISSSPSTEQLFQARSSLDEWRQQISLRNTKLENCTGILHGIAGSLYFPKIKNSSKGNVLMRAMYGVKVQTIFVCSVFAAAFSGSTKTLMDLQISDKLLWTEAFNDLQGSVNGEIRRQLLSGHITVLKELEAVDTCVSNLYPLTIDEVGPMRHAVNLKSSAVHIGTCTERLSRGVDLLSKEVEGFFQIVLAGRDALLGNLREYSSISSPKQEKNAGEQMVR